MSKKVKIIIISIIVAAIMMCTVSCCIIGKNAPTSETGIYSLIVEDISEQAFYTSVISKEYEVTVGTSSEYDIKDIKLVIENPKIAEIKYQIDDTSPSDKILFTIKGLTTGSTSFHFETTDGVIKSEQKDISVIQNVKKISFDTTEDLVFENWEESQKLAFTISSHSSSYSLDENVEFISENPEIVSIEYDAESLLSNKCIITKHSDGETYIYIQTKDKTITSEKIKVIVNPEEIQTTVPQTEEIKNSSYSSETQNTSTKETVTHNSYEEYTEAPESYDEPTEAVKSGTTVYITPTGKKYHYSSSCAGPNAMARDLDEVSGSYGPCKKCAQ